MARLKKGVLLGVKDSTGREIRVGDNIKLGNHVVQVWGSRVKVAWIGKKMDFTRIKREYPDFKVVSKIEDPILVESPTWQVGDVVTNGNCVGYYVSLSESKTAVILACAWIKKTGTISTSWVIPTKGIREPGVQELVEFRRELATKGIFFDSETKQALVSQALYDKGEFIKKDGFVGVVESCSIEMVEFSWCLSDATLSSNQRFPNMGFHRCDAGDAVEAVAQLNRLGFAITPEGQAVKILDNLSADVKSTLIESLKNDSIKQVVDSYREQNLHGKLTIQIEI